MFGRKRKVAKSKSDIVCHNKDYPIITVNIDDMDAYAVLFRNWIRSAGITSITVCSPFDPYEHKDMGLLAEHGDDLSHKSYDVMSAKINTELSNIMFRIIGTRYHTSVLVDNGHWSEGEDYVRPRFRIDHDEYAYSNMVRSEVSSHINYWLCQCDDAPGNDALDDLNRMELGKALVWFLKSGPEKRKTYADIITWVGPDVDPVAFLTGDGMNTAPARLITRAEDYMRHIHASRDRIPEATPDDIMGIADGYVANAESAMTMMREPKPAGGADWNVIVDIIEHSMMTVDALAMTVMTSNIARSNDQLDTVFANTIHDIELMDSEYAAKNRTASMFLRRPSA